MKNKSLDKCRALLDAALDEFSCKSYDEASLNGILKAAGVSKSAFYYHFENKEQLYLHLLDTAAKANWAFISAGLPAGLQAGPDLFELFRLQAELGVQFAAAEPRYHRLYTMFLKEKDNPVCQKAQPVLEGGKEPHLEDMIAGAYDAGAFKKHYSREFVIRIVSHLFSSFHDIFPEAADTEAVLESLRSLIRFIKEGLEK